MAQAQVAQAPHLPTASATIMYSDLCRELIDVEATIRWCQSRKLLAEKKDCVCGRDLVKRKTTPEMRCWRCPRKACRKEVSLRDGTFFAKSHLEIERIIRLIHLWSTRTSLGRMMKETKHAIDWLTRNATIFTCMQISTKTAVDWYNFLRDVCAQYFVDHPVKIGGPGIELEIDESKFGRHKYNRGRYVDEH